MRRTILSQWLCLGVLLATGAGPASAGGLDVRVGGFFPRANSTLFADVDELYGASQSDFNGWTGGIEYNLVLARNVELALSTDFYSRTLDTFYVGYVRPEGSDIFQTLDLDIVPIGFSVRLVPTDKRHKIVPFAAAGVDLFYWEYEEYGDFIDFFQDDYPIYNDYLRSDGWTFGAHVAGGLRFYLNRDFAIVAEGRYQWGGQDMGEDFSPNEPGLINRIDLSGASATIGLHVRF